jgi:copper/silver efflux system protein
VRYCDSAIGGMVSSTLLTLIVIPAIYGIVKGWQLPSGKTVGRHREAKAMETA